MARTWVVLLLCLPFTNALPTPEKSNLTTLMQLISETKQNNCTYPPASAKVCEMPYSPKTVINANVASTTAFCLLLRNLTKNVCDNPRPNQVIPVNVTTSDVCNDLQTTVNLIQQKKLRLKIPEFLLYILKNLDVCRMFCEEDEEHHTLCLLTVLGYNRIAVQSPTEPRTVNTGASQPHVNSQQKTEPELLQSAKVVGLNQLFNSNVTYGSPAKPSGVQQTEISLFHENQSSGKNSKMEEIKDSGALFTNKTKSPHNFVSGIGRFNANGHAQQILGQMSNSEKQTKLPSETIVSKTIAQTVPVEVPSVSETDQTDPARSDQTTKNAAIVYTTKPNVNKQDAKTAQGLGEKRANASNPESIQVGVADNAKTSENKDETSEQTKPIAAQTTTPKEGEKTAVATTTGAKSKTQSTGVTTNEDVSTALGVPVVGKEKPGDDDFDMQTNTEDETSDIGDDQNGKSPISDNDDVNPIEVNRKPVSGGNGNEPLGPQPGYPEYADTHFFTYFLTVVVLCIILYLVFHNKQKIIALIIEGRHERRRRPNTTNYKKLDSNLEEVMQGGKKGVTTTHVIY